jgi:putative transposase
MASDNETAIKEAGAMNPALKEGTSQRRRKADENTSFKKESETKTDRPKGKKHNEQERAEKIRLIDEMISGGKMTLKDAVKSAGVSDETYYQWKKSAKSAGKVANDLSKPETGDESQDLLALEEENKRLRNLLAEKLRNENAELRRRLRSVGG